MTAMGVKYVQYRRLETKRVRALNTLIVSFVTTNMNHISGAVRCDETVTFRNQTHPEWRTPCKYSGV